MTWTRIAPYVLPLCVWGGLLQYPCLLYLAVTGRARISMMTWLCCYILCTHRSKMMGILQISSVGGPVFLHGLGDEDDGMIPGPSIHLVHPHALFTLGINSYIFGHLPHRERVLLISKYLYYLSPMGMLYIVMSGYADVAPLVHGRVKELLVSGANLVVVPGGFVEAADFSRQHESLYLHMYPYWMRMAREYPTYSMYSIFGYNLAGHFFQQAPYLKPLRLALARRGLIGVCPSGFSLRRRLEPVYMYTQRIRPDSDTLESIRASLRRTIDTHDKKRRGARINYVIRTEA